MSFLDSALHVRYEQCSILCYPHVPRTVQPLMVLWFLWFCLNGPLALLWKATKYGQSSDETVENHLSQQVWHDKDLSMLKGFKILISQPIISKDHVLTCLLKIFHSETCTDMIFADEGLQNQNLRQVLTAVFTNIHGKNKINWIV